MVGSPTQWPVRGTTEKAARRSFLSHQYIYHGGAGTGHRPDTANGSRTPRPYLTRGAVRDRKQLSSKCYCYCYMLQ